MNPPINRFIGALQGLPSSGARDVCEEVLDIAESLLANGGFVRDDIASIVSSYGAGTDSCAPLWRAIPFGLLFFRDRERLIADTAECCRLTHTEPADIAASVGVALALARLLQMEEELAPYVFIRELADQLEPFDVNVPMRILTLRQSLRGETPFVGGRLADPLQIFRAALFLFLACPACDLETDSARYRVHNPSALYLAYCLAGSSGLLCRMEKPSLRMLMVGEAFHRFCRREGEIA